VADAQEIRLDTPQGGLAGLAWRRRDAPRALCLHGWLDNAASFVPLARLFGHLDLVAIDLPGHGHSEHRHPTARYHFIDYLFNVDAALDSLGWGNCHLIGHSLGAAIAAAYSAGAPERVRSLVLLDSMGPLSAPATRTADRLRRSLAKSRDGPGKPRRYGSIGEMARARQNVSDLSEGAARLICERAARQADGHFEWRSDPALNWISSLIMTEEQVLDLLRHVVAPTLALTVTEEAPWASKEELDLRRQALRHARHETLEGHHHFHMDDPESIFGTIEEFILRHHKAAQNGERHDEPR
jgi:pimeloyl-ACP methyl ester carboxylesterase